MIKVTLKYYEGLGKEEKVLFDIPETEFEKMVQLDYEKRFAEAGSDEIILKRTPQEIIHEMNKQERNSWEGHYRHLVDLQTETHTDSDMNIMEVLSDSSQEEEHQRREEYEEVCQRIRQVLKSKQAEMIIAICIDGMAVKDYAKQIGDKPIYVTQRLNYAKNILRANLGLRDFE